MPPLRLTIRTGSLVVVADSDVMVGASVGVGRTAVAVGSTVAVSVGSTASGAGPVVGSMPGSSPPEVQAVAHKRKQSKIIVNRFI